MSEYIFIKDLSFSYPDSSVSIFENLSLSFYEGWTVISGANGAGKSTLFSLIQGSIVPDSGIVRTSGEIAYCPQVFDGLDYMDIAAIYDGSQENGRLKSMLSITDSMIENPAALSGGEKKRLQLLAAFSHHPSIMLMDEPTNHLDQMTKDMILPVLREFSGCGIMISHDRTFSQKLSDRTIIFERVMGKPVSIYDISLPLHLAIEENARRKQNARNAYDSLSSAVNVLQKKAVEIKEKSSAMHRKLSKSGLDVHDHSAKAAIDGARLTGKDKSLEGVRRRILSHAEHKLAELSGMERPVMRKEGLDFTAGEDHQKSISFPQVILSGGMYKLHVPELAVRRGAHVAITGSNGSGKTLLVKYMNRILKEKGKSDMLLYIPQEYAKEDREHIFKEVAELSDDEKGQLLSDLYRLGAEPSFLLDDETEPSPGELKKLDFALSRRKGKSIIIMDEPTNHLDIVSMGIFESIFRKDDDTYTLFLVSHDKAFLDATCSIVWHIERENMEGSISVII